MLFLLSIFFTHLNKLKTVIRLEMRVAETKKQKN